MSIIATPLSATVLAAMLAVTTTISGGVGAPAKNVAHSVENAAIDYDAKDINGVLKEKNIVDGDEYENTYDFDEGTFTITAEDGSYSETVTFEEFGAMFENSVFEYAKTEEGAALLESAGIDLDSPPLEPSATSVVIADYSVQTADWRKTACTIFVQLGVGGSAAGWRVALALASVHPAVRIVTTLGHVGFSQFLKQYCS